MSRKDYVLVARAMASTRPVDIPDPAGVWLRAVGMMADHFAADSARFDRFRFVAACGAAS